MLLMLLKYHFLRVIRTKELMFWSLAFPLILGTLFFVSFSSITKRTEAFAEISTAYVEADGKDQIFEQFLEKLSSVEKPLIRMNKVSEKEAKRLLAENEVRGIFFNQEELRLMVNEEGVAQSILKTLLEEYQIKRSIIESIAVGHPERVSAVVDEIEGNYIREREVTDGNLDPMVNYFYALIAMSCLFGSFLGNIAATDFKANISAIAVRRVTASTNRFLILITDIIVNILIQFLNTTIAVCYLRYILKIELGNQMPLILLTVLAGSVIGVATGFFIGSLGKGSRDVKMSISSAITMLECFLSGLMIASMYVMVEKSVPILNRINPAALILDSLYSLNIYDTYERYTKNMISLLAIAVLLIGFSFLAVRRERYASI